MQIRHTHAGFTLVELIVTISILTILGTIGFANFSGFQWDARNSVRTETIATLGQWLEIRKSTTGQFPAPEGNVLSGTFDGKTLAYVGEIQNGIRSIAKINELPKDPLSGNYYVYGTDVSYSYYQIATVMENAMGYRDGMVPTAYADNGLMARVHGNYNGLIKSGTGIYNVPSLIFAGSGNLIASTAYFIADKQANLPYRIGDQVNLSPKTTGEILSAVTNGVSQTLTGRTLPQTQAELVAMSANLVELGYSIDVIGIAVLGDKYQKTTVLENCLLWNGTSTGSSVDDCSL